MLSLTILVIVLFFTRNFLVTFVANHYLAIYNTQVTCLHLNINAQFDIDVNEMCISSPFVDIKADNIVIQWHNLFEPKIQLISVNTMKIKGNKVLLDNSAPQNSQSKNSFDLVAIQQYLRAIAQQESIPNINISKVSYQPFYLNKKHNIKTLTATAKEEHQYSGQLSVFDNVLDFSLKQPLNTNVLSGKLQITNTTIAAQLTTNLAPLIALVAIHQLKLPEDITDKVGIDGTLKSEMKYKFNDKKPPLIVHHQLNNLSLKFDNKSTKDGSSTFIRPFHVQGTLNWLTTLSKETLVITFEQENKLAVNFEDDQLAKLASHHHLSPFLIQTLQDNQVTKLVASPHGKITVDFAKNHTAIAAIDINANINDVNTNITLDDIVLNYGKNKLTSNLLTQLSFAINGQLFLNQLQALSHQPMLLNASGSLELNPTGVNVVLQPMSYIGLSQITLPQLDKNVPSKARNKRLFNLASARTRIHGTINIAKNSPAKLSLKIKTDLQGLHIPKVLQAAAIVLNSDISGDSDNIKIVSNLIIDNIELGKIKINGPITKPTINISSNGLQLTDLLTLKLELPIDIALIDGTIDYTLESQFFDWGNVKDNAIALNFTVMDLSGEVNGIWLQTLNWQQAFILRDGKISSVANASKNLNIDSIESTTPISKLSLSTAWQYNKDGIKLTATDLVGDVLGGSFSLPKFQWPIENGHSVDVKLTSIDLDKVLELDKKQGIVVTGEISGQLPMIFDGEKYIITDGELHNVSNGLIQIFDNPAVDELKRNNSQLKLAFDALQNLHYHQLSSDVSLADDGYMQLETIIKGRNPDIDNDVNLNLNLSYDLLGLLESLSITQRFENGIIKELQKH
jgi:hypothetical protein